MTVLGAQKNRLIETKNRLSEMVLLSTHNICYGSKISKNALCYTLLTKGLKTRLWRAVGSDDNCTSRGHEFDPGPVPFFCGV